MRRKIVLPDVIRKIENLYNRGIKHPSSIIQVFEKNFCIECSNLLKKFFHLYITPKDKGYMLDFVYPKICNSFGNDVRTSASPSSLIYTSSSMRTPPNSGK